MGDEVKIVAVISNPLQFKIPSWMLNRQRDVKDGKTSQKYANFLDQALREDIERMKRVRLHRGLRHYWGIRVRGQHTKTTGRHRAHIEENSVEARRMMSQKTCFTECMTASLA